VKRKAFSSLLPSLLSILAGLLVGAVIILFNGENPLAVYFQMIVQPLSNIKNFFNVLYVSTPLIVVGLAFVVAIKAGMINLGLEGQLLLGSITGVYVATLFPGIPWFIYIPIIMASAMIVGALWALIPAYTKIRFGASEIVTCIMLNYVVEYLINFIISGGYFKHPEIAQRTPYINDNAFFPSLSDIFLKFDSIAMRGVQLNAMFLIAIGLVAVIYILMFKTKWGYKMNAVGYNMKAATANRMNAKKIMILSMMLSGGIAGIAATGEVLGTFRGFVEGFSPGYGFSGISVALLGRNHPVGVILSAIFFSILNQGMVFVGTNSSIPQDFGKILQTLILIFIVISPYTEGLVKKLFSKNTRQLA
jgi:simple sugar transport system permease protein